MMKHLRTNAGKSLVWLDIVLLLAKEKTTGKGGSKREEERDIKIQKRDNKFKRANEIPCPLKVVFTTLLFWLTFLNQEMIFGLTFLFCSGISCLITVENCYFDIDFID